MELRRIALCFFSPFWNFSISQKLSTISTSPDSEKCFLTGLIELFLQVIEGHTKLFNSAAILTYQGARQT